MKDYIPKWSPPKSEALKRLRSVRDVRNANLSHLTWDRVAKRRDAGQNPDWDVAELADDVLTVFTDFVAKLQRDDADMADRFSGVLASAWVNLRGVWPEILPTERQNRQLV